jgi:sec-independent protein translocase protein TatB
VRLAAITGAADWVLPGTVAVVFDSVGWGEILVLIVAGLFILGPERLPSAAAWVGKSIRQVREYATGAREQLRNELGPEFDELRKPLEELRGLRNFNPRAAATRAFFDDDPPVKPNGFAPGPNGAQNGTVQNGAAQNGATPDLTKPAKPSLAKNELPPIDDDAT